MDIKYNIYRICNENLKKLEQNLDKTGLKKQKTKSFKNFISTFYFSEEQDGNDVWWINYYKSFLNDPKITPKNLFHYGLLISKPKSKRKKFSYLVSLGKSHFYLGKYIERDFGINLAIRMANEESTLLKKSTYFASIKTGEMSSYNKFIKDNYDPGESVDHLKAKAQNIDEWGDRNIIFSDSVQISAKIPPEQIDSLLEKIEKNMMKGEVISLPKLEPVKDIDLKDELDKNLLNAIREGKSSFSLSEFEVLGGHIILTSDAFNYSIYTKSSREPEENLQELGQTLEKEKIIKYLATLDSKTPISDIKIKSYHESMTRRSKCLKEVIDFSFTFNNQQYLLRHGTWFVFNSTFMQYLERSINKIPLSARDNLIESDYLAWKIEKEEEIKKTPDSVESKITYREYYFNNKLCQLHNYELLDRKTEQVTSIKENAQDYKVEIADLYDARNGEVIALKISDDISELIYNITQSLTALELHKRAFVGTDRAIQKASLWFVFQKEINQLTDINSINFLLSLEHWRKSILALGFEIGIYISKHIKKTT
ncbi:DUF6119 family protein [Aeromonas enteropelogenes]|uniref:DUF6119 family protein n=1 Tax=Aeromonas enteropelogenes TaxID=29489 RepID=UPI00398620D6